MASINYIKDLYENEGKSFTEIAKRLEIDPRTVKKYALMDDWSYEESRVRKSTYRVLGPYIEIINKWLDDDTKIPRKQRHTARRIFNRLKEEHDFPGSERSVSTYVSKMKYKLNKKSKGYLPLKHEQGEAQLDFGEFTYIKDNENKKGYFLNITFPYSNAGFTQVFESQNLECVQEGLKRFFNEIGGVPHELVMDNMSSVVARINPDGERILTEGFNRFMLHYRFKSRFCNRAAGNEKGNVENKVGYIRRNLFVPVPHISNLEQYNKELMEKCKSDMNRKHYKKSSLIKDLWEEEKSSLLVLPPKEHESFKVKDVIVDNYGYISFENNKYVATPMLSQQKIIVKATYNKVHLYYKGKNIATYARSYEKGKEISDWRQYISLLIHKPGGLEYTKFFDELPRTWRDHLKNTYKDERRNCLKILKQALDEDKLDASIDAIKIAYSKGRPTSENIKQIYYHFSKYRNVTKPISIDKSVPIATYNPTLAVYNKLTGGSSNE